MPPSRRATRLPGELARIGRSHQFKALFDILFSVIDGDVRLFVDLLHLTIIVGNELLHGGFRLMSRARVSRCKTIRPRHSTVENGCLCDETGGPTRGREFLRFLPHLQKLSIAMISGGHICAQQPSRQSSHRALIPTRGA